MGIELSSFYPHDDSLAPEIQFNGANILVKVGFVSSASLTTLRGSQGGPLGETGMVLIGVAVNLQGDIVELVEVPSEVGRTDGSELVDWQARLKKAMQLFQSE